MANIFDDFGKQTLPESIPVNVKSGRNIFDSFANPSSRTDTIINKKRDTKTVEGLSQLARDKGLGEEAKKLTGTTGENPNKIFSGGIISDIFDALSVGQYAVAGIVEGKGAVKGIEERASFTDPELLGRFGTPGKIAGVIADIFIDPINLIPVFGIGTKALTKIKQGTKFLSETKVAKPVADALGRAFVYRFGQDPVYVKEAEKMITAIARGQEYGLELGTQVTKLGKEADLKIGQWLRGEITDLEPDLAKVANQVRNEFKSLGEESVKLGLLDADTYFGNMNKYMPRLYTKHELPTQIQKYVAGIKPNRTDISRFMKREDIPEEIRKSMGEILEAGYPTAKGIAQMRQAVETTKFFNFTAEKFAKDVAEEGLTKLPDTKRLGTLSGKYVPGPIFDDINEIIKSPSAMEKALNKAVAGFKFGKVVLNPATHVRNIMSNFVLNDFEGLSPSRLDIYAKAAKSILKKDEFYQEAKKMGLGLNTFASQEISDLLNPKNGIGGVVRTAADKLSSIYQKEEEFAKMAQFIFQKSKGLSSEEAWKVAERATFNYAQVTPFIRKLRQSAFGFPFITFTYKVTPQVARTIVQKPGVVSKIGKIARGVESLSPQQELTEERGVEPDYIKNGFFVKLPGKDEYGRSGYFDLTYILPFGDLVSGQFFGQPREGETRLQAILREQPLFNAIAELATNKDFFGKPIVKPDSVDGSAKALDIFSYIAKFYGPPTLTDFPFRLKQSAEFEAMPNKTIGEGTRQTKTVAQEALRGIFGLKVQPFDVQSQATLRDKEKKQALEDFLKAKGIGAEFKTFFIPKEKK